MLACSCVLASEPVRFEKRALHMGVEWEVIVYQVDGKSDRDAMAAIDAAMARIEQLDKILSDYSPTSELSKLSDSAPTSKPIPLSDDLYRVLAAADELSAQSDGAFDVTLGSLTKLWRRARRQQALPGAEQLQEALACTGQQHLKLDHAKKTAELTRARMRLDLGGIAKGFAAQEGLAVLQQLGFPRAMVRGSGDFALGDPPPGEKGWRVGLAPIDPDAKPDFFVVAANCAISTSGDSRQHLIVDGRRYSHLIDPRTGLGIERQSSVTVIAPTGLLADGLASAISILGPDRGAKLAQSQADVAMRMIVREPSGKESIIETRIERWAEAVKQKATSR
ncbi:ApbE family lipoprotein [Pirellula staleyi DSM 6068]|uniref:FAD:protein FMN transferase n=1 Tax=Pirellula staleyi (strain ATCC 27377 / DSM 6068 / ICPB 4128) TaxID=530564 RepID=D2QWH1_PIRSD|nr:ApbE family lipoprotein [Pirellula staleyi DSM 6068]